MRALNLLRAVAFATAAVALAPASYAIDGTGDVSVRVTLTSKCQFQAGQNVVFNFGTYTAFQNLDKTIAAKDLVFECTRGAGTAPTFAWDATNGDDTGAGVIAGLAYKLTAEPGATKVDGAAPTLITGAGADVMTVKVNGFMAKDQAGDVNAPQGPVTRTLTVSF